jgi:CubicO group peptidase (beta-lactamase class C family)
MLQIDHFIQCELSRQKIPGIAVGIFHNGQPIHMKGYGLSNIEHDVPVKMNTVFQTASIGKMFTAIAVLTLVEDQKINLDESIRYYLPKAPKSWQPITIRHLLTHTSGLSTIEPNPLQEFTDEQYLDQYYSASIEFTPGDRWSYSNTGYSILGLMINEVSGQHYGQILKDRVFLPANMQSARIISEHDIVMNRAGGYENFNGELKNQQWVSSSTNTLAEGSLYLSLEDYQKWDLVIASRGILSKHSWDQIFSPVLLNHGQSYPYGFGWDIESINENKLVIGHEGSWQGFRTALLRFDDDGITFVVLANSSHANVGHILRGIANLYNDQYIFHQDQPIFDHFPSLTFALISEIERIASHKKFERIESNIDFDELINIIYELKLQKLLGNIQLIKDQQNGNHLDRTYKNSIFTIYVSFNTDLNEIHSLFIFIEK